MSALAATLKITPAEYLTAEITAPTRSEYVQGEVYAMAGASDGHVTVTGNLFALLKPQLRGSGCKTYISDMKLRIGTDDAYYYPDLMVSCDPADHQRNYVKQTPTLIVEVLSPSTEAYDRGGKFAFYRQLTSLQEYVLIDPRTYRVDVFRRTPQNRWELFNFEGKDTEVEFASLNFRCTMSDIYEDVDFELTHTTKIC